MDIDLHFECTKDAIAAIPTVIIFEYPIPGCKFLCNCLYHWHLSIITSNFNNSLPYLIEETCFLSTLSMSFVIFLSMSFEIAVAAVFSVLRIGLQSWLPWFQRLFRKTSDPAFLFVLFISFNYLLMYNCSKAAMFS